MERTARISFDRGTVLVETDRRIDLPGALWDDRVGAHRAPAVRHGELRAALERSGHQVLGAVLGGGEPPAAWPVVELRPYQHAALDAWELHGRRGVLVMPTGSGKTRVALAVVARTRMRTLCLVPTRALLEQWTSEIASRSGAVVGCYGDGRHELAPVTVATFESAYRNMDQLGNRFDLLVVDEVHHFGSGVRDEALEMSAATARLGLTATPPTGDAARRLGELVGPCVFELAIGDLAGSFLASFDLVTLRLELEPHERSLYDRLRDQFLSVLREFQSVAPGADWAHFVARANRTEVGRAALAALRTSQRITTYPTAKRRAVASLLARHRSSRVLIFTADNETAYAIAREHLVTPLTCDIDRRERREALDAFRDGRLRALVSARVLNEGIDVPDADVAIIVAGTQGEREHVQRVGRLLRPRAGKRAVVYELVCGGTHETRVAQRRRRALAPQRSAKL